MSLALWILYLWFTSNWMAAMLDLAKKADPLEKLDLRSLKQRLNWISRPWKPLERCIIYASSHLMLDFAKMTSDHYNNIWIGFPYPIHDYIDVSFMILAHLVF